MLVCADFRNSQISKYLTINFGFDLRFARARQNAPYNIFGYRALDTPPRNLICAHYAVSSAREMGPLSDLLRKEDTVFDFSA